MGEKEDREKAEKLAAAKKRVAQLQKKKKAAAGTAGAEKSTAAGSKTKQKGKKDTDKDKDKEEEIAGDEDGNEPNEIKDEKADDGEDAVEEKESTAEEPDVQTREELELGDGDSDEAAFNDAIKAANANDGALAQEDDKFPDIKSPSTGTDGDSAASGKHSARQPSISLQSKMRSTSFRQSSAPLSPSATEAGGDDSLYRKQNARISELEEETKRLTKEVAEGEGRWRKSEVELEELREKTAEAIDDHSQAAELERLREEISSLRRNQRQSASAGVGKARQGSVPRGTSDESELKKELESKESIISDLQLEISRLRSQVLTQNQGSESRDEQVAALQSGLEKAETNIRKLENDLADTKKALNRASEKAVVEGTEKTSKETKIKSLERETEELKGQKSELDKKIDNLEKKIEAMNKLHKETEQRTATKLSTAEAQAREAAMLRNKIESLEKDNSRLREAKKNTMSGDGGDEGLDELEDEERKKLEKRIRDLEGEVFELRRGAWRDKRKEMQPGMADGEGDEFDDVDLGGSGGQSRRRSTTSQSQAKHSGFTQVLNSGIAAFRSSTLSPDSQARHQTRPRNDSLLQDFDGDDDGGFDEHAFAVAQKEEEMKKMVEHVREVKKGLKNWVGWRLDLVDSRKGGGGWGVGEVFDI